ncbi:MAG: nuclear transport factor 2 family protein [Aquincola sp.]|nr:nuclear transport factor 2 family protein [Aquincola sp.]MDH5329679.1 nuclear transport factor 2 family protein [Aquincola sp.]
MPRHADVRVARVVAFFESLTPADIARLPEFYRDDARFKDPFNEVQGTEAIAEVFSHMYRALHEPRFVVHALVAEGDQCFLTWDFQFRFRRFEAGRDQTVRGGSHLVFAADGRIAAHRDYWDAAEELYEKLPGVGVLMRWLKRQASR